MKTAWVFASENPEKPIWRDNIWYRHMKPKLDPAHGESPILPECEVFYLLIPLPECAISLFYSFI